MDLQEVFVVVYPHRHGVLAKYQLFTYTLYIQPFHFPRSLIVYLGFLHQQYLWHGNVSYVFLRVLTQQCIFVCIITSAVDYLVKEVFTKFCNFLRTCMIFRINKKKKYQRHKIHVSLIHVGTFLNLILCWQFQALPQHRFRKWQDIPKILRTICRLKKSLYVNILI